MPSNEIQKYHPARIKLLEKVREQSTEELKKGGAYYIDGRLHVTRKQIAQARQEMKRVAKLTPQQIYGEKLQEWFADAKLLDSNTTALYNYPSGESWLRTSVDQYATDPYLIDDKNLKDVEQNVSLTIIRRNPIENIIYNERSYEKDKETKYSGLLIPNPREYISPILADESGRKNGHY